MRVIHLMSTDDYSGAENVAINIVNGLYNLEIETYYATQKGKIDEFLKEKKVKNVIHIDALNVKEIRRIEKEYNPDIIHAHDYKASILAAIACKKAKVISHIHNNSPWIKKFFHPYSWVLLFASIKFSKILLVSDSIKNEYVFSKLISKKLEVVGNPISCEQITKNVTLNTEKKYDICFVGRLTEQKNPLRFIEIINGLKKQNPKIKVIMLGDGELKRECQKLINNYDLQENILLLGFKKNVFEYMNESKIFCLTSKWEGYGLVAFEALTLGLPAIVSPVGGLVDIVNNNCGKLCSSNTEFENEIFKLLNNVEYYNKKSYEAIIRSIDLENFAQYMKNIKKIYEEIYK